MVDDDHLTHQLFVRQVRVPLGDQRIVQRDKGQPATPVPGGQTFNLSPANPAVAVVDDHIGPRPLGRCRQRP